MATIQARKCRGYKYWYIVESRRINGKPRPIVIECLGSTKKLLERLQNKNKKSKIKSYSHGSIAALLTLAKQLDIVSIINKYTYSQRGYWTEKPLRNNITAGITLILAAIGRVSQPTSKRGWYSWAKTTTCDHLLRISLAQIDSQHFWDLMDCIPEENIGKNELEILQKTLEYYPINSGTLLYDTTNFYTFINSTNDRCEIAQRGKNKQKRHDLRQVGLALVVTQENYIPILHHTYKGNIGDSKVFAKIIRSIKSRMVKLKMDIDQHTIVFDRGCNSKDNLKKVKRHKLNYVGALTPYHHQDLIEVADGKFDKIQVGDTELEVYREKREIWGEKRTVLVFVSEKLKTGQLRGIYQSLEKKKKSLRCLQRDLKNPRGKKRTKEQLEKKIEKDLQGQFMEGLISYELTELTEGHWSLTYHTNKKKLANLEDDLGFRIIMTNRHKWESEKIIQAFFGQSIVENSFKNIKNPYHLAITPGFHWTTHKIKIHYFICVLGYLLSALTWYEARKTGFNGTLDNLLDSLNDIRLSRIIELSSKQGRPKVTYQLEEMSKEQETLFEALNLNKVHLKPLKIEGISVYN